MALKTDYVDAVFSGNRQYNMVANSNGTYSFIDVTDYEVAGSYFGAEDINETNETVNNLDLGLSDGTVTRVGTGTVGSATQPIYLSYGYPTALSGTAGSASRPVYLNNGVITACSDTLGGAASPIYSNSGTLTACSSTVGSATQPVYMNGGTITACNTTVGSGARPIYSNGGVLTACTSTVGSATTPAYMSSGTITACTSIGSWTAFSITAGSGSWTASEQGARGYYNSMLKLGYIETWISLSKVSSSTTHTLWTFTGATPLVAQTVICTYRGSSGMSAEFFLNTDRSIAAYLGTGDTSYYRALFVFPIS